MPHPTCYTSSSIGPCPDLHKNFLDRPETVSIYWDDAKIEPEDNAFFRAIHHCEPPDVFPEVADRIIAQHKNFDLVMTYDTRVLRECSNAVFITESACSWFPRKSGAAPDPFGRMNYGGGVTHKNPVVSEYVGCDVSKKNFEVSFLTSSKNIFPGHVLRQEVFEKLPGQVGSIKTWKHKSPPIVNDKRDILEPYMFSIVPENSRHEGYYTEKIIDCLVAKTIPVYWGCPNISEYFDLDGIVVFQDYAELLKQLEKLTPEFYHNRAEVIDSNLRAALRGVYQWDQIEQAISNGIRLKQTEGNKRVDSPAPVSDLPYKLYRPLRAR